MTFAVTRSVPLGENTRAAIREAGGMFFRRERTEEYISEYLRYNEQIEFLLNLGNSGMNVTTDMPVFNDPSVVTSLYLPTTTRELLDDLMPGQTGDQEFIWSKGPGRGGRNKVQLPSDTNFYDFPFDYWEDHVDGDEYRLITVGHKVVQQFKRLGGNNERLYQWVPRREVPHKLKSAVREASRRLPTTRSVIAWDTIWSDDEQPYILEGNTSPGMNLYTINRIVEAIREQIREEVELATD